MKYTIEGFQQSSLVAYGLDVSDTIILRYIVDFYHTGEMYHKIIDMKIYFWVSYKSIISNLPVLNITCRKTIERRFKKYVKCGLMENLTVRGNDEYIWKDKKRRRHGTYSYFHFNSEKLVALLRPLNERDYA